MKAQKLDNLNKVLLVTTEFPPQPGGIGTHALAIATNLTERGFEVTVSCDQRSQNGVEEQQFDAKQLFKVIRTKRMKPIFRTFFKRITLARTQAKQADVVLVSGKFSLWIGGFLKSTKDSKVVAIVHGTELLLKNRLLSKWMNVSLLKMDACISVSNYTASLLKDATGLVSTVIPNGYSFTAKIPVFTKPKKTILKFITVGNVTQRKGQHNVINTIPLLNKKYKNVFYEMAGIPTDKEEVSALAKSLGVFDQISFLGRISEENKVKTLQESHIFAMLSEKTATGDVEGFGIAILEANALGIPAIGAKFCGIEDAIKDGFSGILVDPQNPAAFVAAVDNIQQDYKKYAENAVAWASKFTWNQLIDDYIVVLRSL